MSHREDDDPIDGVFTDLGKAVMVEPQWVVKGLVPVGLTVVGSPPKSKKSTVVMALALWISEHQCAALPPFARVVPRHMTGPVMVISHEAIAGELRHMCETGLGTKVRSDESILIADDPYAFMLDDEDGLERLMRWLKVREPRALIIDPFRNSHQAEEKDSGEMIRILRPLRKWAVENDAAVLLVHHTRKPADEGGKAHTYGATDLRGSSAIFGAADGILMFTPVSDEKLRIEGVFKRGSSWANTFILGAYENVGKGREVLEQLDEMILAIVRNHGPLGTSEIVRNVQGQKVRVDFGLQRLLRNGLVKKGARGWAVVK